MSCLTSHTRGAQRVASALKNSSVTPNSSSFPHAPIHTSARRIPSRKRNPHAVLQRALKPSTLDADISSRSSRVDPTKSEISIDAIDSMSLEEIIALTERIKKLKTAATATTRNDDSQRLVSLADVEKQISHSHRDNDAPQQTRDMYINGEESVHRGKDISRTDSIHKTSKSGMRASALHIPEQIVSKPATELTSSLSIGETVDVLPEFKKKSGKLSHKPFLSSPVLLDLFPDLQTLSHSEIQGLISHFGRKNTENSHQSAEVPEKSDISTENAFSSDLFPEGKKRARKTRKASVPDLSDPLAAAQTALTAILNDTTATPNHLASSSRVLSVHPPSNPSDVATVLLQHLFSSYSVAPPNSHPSSTPSSHPSSQISSQSSSPTSKSSSQPSVSWLSALTEAEGAILGYLYAGNTTQALVCLLNNVDVVRASTGVHLGHISEEGDHAGKVSDAVASTVVSNEDHEEKKTKSKKSKKGRDTAEPVSIGGKQARLSMPNAAGYFIKSVDASALQNALSDASHAINYSESTVFPYYRVLQWLITNLLIDGQVAHAHAVYNITREKIQAALDAIALQSTRSVLSSPDSQSSATANAERTMNATSLALPPASSFLLASSLSIMKVAATKSTSPAPQPPTYTSFSKPPVSGILGPVPVFSGNRKGGAPVALLGVIEDLATDASEACLYGLLIRQKERLSTANHSPSHAPTPSAVDNHADNNYNPTLSRHLAHLALTPLAPLTAASLSRLYAATQGLRALCSLRAAEAVAVEHRGMGSGSGNGRGGGSISWADEQLRGWHEQWAQRASAQSSGSSPNATIKSQAAEYDTTELHPQSSSVPPSSSQSSSSSSQQSSLQSPSPSTLKEPTSSTSQQPTSPAPFRHRSITVGTHLVPRHNQQLTPSPANLCAPPHPLLTSSITHSNDTLTSGNSGDAASSPSTASAISSAGTPLSPLHYSVLPPHAPLPLLTSRTMPLPAATSPLHVFHAPAATTAEQRQHLARITRAEWVGETGISGNSVVNVEHTAASPPSCEKSTQSTSADLPYSLTAPSVMTPLAPAIQLYSIALASLEQHLAVLPEYVPTLSLFTPLNMNLPLKARFPQLAAMFPEDSLPTRSRENQNFPSTVLNFPDPTPGVVSIEPSLISLLFHLHSRLSHHRHMATYIENTGYTLSIPALQPFTAPTTQEHVAIIAEYIATQFPPTTAVATLLAPIQALHGYTQALTATLPLESASRDGHSPGASGKKEKPSSNIGVDISLPKTISLASLQDTKDSLSVEATKKPTISGQTSSLAVDFPIPTSSSHIVSTVTTPSPLTYVSAVMVDVTPIPVHAQADAGKFKNPEISAPGSSEIHENPNGWRVKELLGANVTGRALVGTRHVTPTGIPEKEHFYFRKKSPAQVSQLQRDLEYLPPPSMLLLPVSTQAPTGTGTASGTTSLASQNADIVSAPANSSAGIPPVPNSATTVSPDSIGHRADAPIVSESLLNHLIPLLRSQPLSLSYYHSAHRLCARLGYTEAELRLSQVIAASQGSDGVIGDSAVWSDAGKGAEWLRMSAGVAIDVGNCVLEVCGRPRMLRNMLPMYSMTVDARAREETLKEYEAWCTAMAREIVSGKRFSGKDVVFGGFLNMDIDTVKLALGSVSMECIGNDHNDDVIPMVYVHAFALVNGQAEYFPEKAWMSTDPTVDTSMKPRKTSKKTTKGTDNAVKSVVSEEVTAIHHTEPISISAKSSDYHFTLLVRYLSHGDIQSAISFANVLFSRLEIPIPRSFRDLLSHYLSSVHILHNYAPYLYDKISPPTLTPAHTHLGPHCIVLTTPERAELDAVTPNTVNTNVLAPYMTQGDASVKADGSSPTQAHQSEKKPDRNMKKKDNSTDARQLKTSLSSHSTTASRTSLPLSPSSSNIASTPAAQQLFWWVSASVTAGILASDSRNIKVKKQRVPPGVIHEVRNNIVVPVSGTAIPKSLTAASSTTASQGDTYATPSDNSTSSSSANPMNSTSSSTQSHPEEKIPIPDSPSSLYDRARSLPLHRSWLGNLTAAERTQYYKTLLLLNMITLTDNTVLPVLPRVNDGAVTAKKGKDYEFGVADKLQIFPRGQLGMSPAAKEWGGSGRMVVPALYGEGSRRWWIDHRAVDIDPYSHMPLEYSYTLTQSWIQHVKKATRDLLYKKLKHQVDGMRQGDQCSTLGDHKSGDHVDHRIDSNDPNFEDTFNSIVLNDIPTGLASNNLKALRWGRNLFSDFENKTTTISLKPRIVYMDTHLTNGGLQTRVQWPPAMNKRREMRTEQRVADWRSLYGAYRFGEPPLHAVNAALPGKTSHVKTSNSPASKLVAVDDNNNPLPDGELSGTVRDGVYYYSGGTRVNAEYIDTKRNLRIVSSSDDIDSRFKQYYNTTLRVLKPNHSKLIDVGAASENQLHQSRPIVVNTGTAVLNRYNRFNEKVKSSTISDTTLHHLTNSNPDQDTLKPTKRNPLLSKASKLALVSDTLPSTIAGDWPCIHVTHTTHGKLPFFLVHRQKLASNLMAEYKGRSSALPALVLSATKRLRRQMASMPRLQSPSDLLNNTRRHTSGFGLGAADGPRRPGNEISLLGVVAGDSSTIKVVRSETVSSYEDYLPSTELSVTESSKNDTNPETNPYTTLSQSLSTPEETEEDRERAAAREAARVAAKKAREAREALFASMLPKREDVAGVAGARVTAAGDASARLTSTGAVKPSSELPPSSAKQAIVTATATIPVSSVTLRSMITPPAPVSETSATGKESTASVQSSSSPSTATAHVNDSVLPRPIALKETSTPVSHSLFDVPLYEITPTLSTEGSQLPASSAEWRVSTIATAIWEPLIRTTRRVTNPATKLSIINAVSTPDEAKIPQTSHDASSQPVHIAVDNNDKTVSPTSAPRTVDPWTSVQRWFTEKLLPSIADTIVQLPNAALPTPTAASPRYSATNTCANATNSGSSESPGSLAEQSANASVGVARGLSIMQALAQTAITNSTQHSRIFNIPDCVLIKANDEALAWKHGQESLSTQSSPSSSQAAASSSSSSLAAILDPIIPYIMDVSTSADTLPQCANLLRRPIHSNSSAETVTDGEHSSAHPDDVDDGVNMPDDLDDMAALSSRRETVGPNSLDRRHRAPLWLLNASVDDFRMFNMRQLRYKSALGIMNNRSKPLFNNNAVYNRIDRQIKGSLVGPHLFNESSQAKLNKQKMREEKLDIQRMKTQKGKHMGKRHKK